MLTGLLWFVGLLPLGMAIDWLVCTRVAAYRTGYEYSYRPGNLRYALLTLALASAAYAKAIYDPTRQPIAALVIAGIFLLVWSQVAVRDVERHLVPSDEVPKRYAESDY